MRQNPIAKKTEILEVLVAFVLAILTIIVVLQNTKAIETRLLFITGTMPQAVFLMVTLIAGIAVSLLFVHALSGKPYLAGKQVGLSMDACQGPPKE